MLTLVAMLLNVITEYKLINILENTDIIFEISANGNYFRLEPLSYGRNYAYINLKLLGKNTAGRAGQDGNSETVMRHAWRHWKLKLIAGK